MLSWSDAPNWRKWPKTSFLAIWIIQKGIFSEFWMIQHGRYGSPLVKIILYNHYMQFEVNPMHLTQENGQKPHFWLFGSFKKAFFVNFEWSSMGDTMANSCASFNSIKICNIGSIWCPKREKLAETHMDHSKGPKRVDASYGKRFKKRTRFFRNMRFSRWYS